MAVTGLELHEARCVVELEVERLKAISNAMESGL
jgi:hypothetical protein